MYNSNKTNENIRFIFSVACIDYFITQIRKKNWSDYTTKPQFMKKKKEKEIRKCQCCVKRTQKQKKKIAPAMAKCMQLVLIFGYFEWFDVYSIFFQCCFHVFLMLVILFSTLRFHSLIYPPFLVYE